MNENGALEAHIGRLLATYAEQAEVRVDPMAMTRLATAGGPRSRVWDPPFAPARLALGFVLLLVATLTVVGGALLAGGTAPDAPQATIRAVGPEPFLGLPPAAAASDGERGDLELSFGGRILSHGFDRMWVYTDGRLVWLWENPSPSPVKERRLSPEGVALLRSELLRTARIVTNPDPDGSTGGAGVLWGWASLRFGDRVAPVSWSDAALPMRLADPASWLPPSAWEDPRTFGYVAPSYAVCLWPDAGAETLDRLPATVTTLLQANGVPIHEPGAAARSTECYAVTLQVAREIDDALTEAGLVRRLSHAVTFRVRDLSHAEFELRLLPMTPDGEVICDCG